MCLNLTIIIMISCYLTAAVTQGLTIRELSAEDDMEAVTSGPVTESIYRKSLARIKETPHRVPEHLQFVPQGFVYEDADDVIHVIDPPKHFEELKKIMQRQQQQQQQQRQQLHNLRPIALREQRPKPKIVKTKLPTKFRGEVPAARKATPALDLQTQETQHLPLEILASVRKTENYLRKFKPQLPAARQRLKTHKVQTVIWEKQQEQQQYQQGQEQKLQGIKEQTVANRRRFNTKRFRRDTTKTEKGQQSLKGEALLNHINELIKNASTYLELTDNYELYPPAHTAVDAATSQPEILVEIIENPANNSSSSSSTRSEDMLKHILENSVKDTNVIMQQLKSYTNLATVTEKCDYLKVTYPHHIQNLQNQIKCMQNFIKDLNLTPQYEEEEQQQHQQQQQQHKYLDVNQNTNKTSPQHLDSRKTKDLSYKHFIKGQLADDDDDYTTVSAPSPLNNSLIYDDVMTTILNMLKLQNLQTLEEAASRSTTPSTWQDSTTTTTASVSRKESTQPSTEFHNLHAYLSSLESIVTYLSDSNYKSLNLPEPSQEEDDTFAKYYFLNPQGSGYNSELQTFQEDIITANPATVFYQFPDLSFVKEYLINGSLP